MVDETKLPDDQLFMLIAAILSAGLENKSPKEAVDNYQKILNASGKGATPL